MDQAERLRAIIKQQNQVNKSNARIITVTSGKGGVGKSSVSINLALQFRKQGKRVIIFDADFGLANIEVMFGVIPKYTLADLMFKGKELKDIITEGPNGVQFVSGGSGIARLVNLDREQVKRILYKLSELENLADVINHFKVVSFDNLAIKQLCVQDHLPAEQWEEFYMGDDGNYTFYIDMVDGTFSKNSLATERYPIMDNIDEMFQKIQNERKD